MHHGMVTKINSGSIIVCIETQKACAACSMKNVCSAAGNEKKEIEIVHTKEEFKIGEQVNVIIAQSSGFKAVLLGYIMPFIILTITLSVALRFSSEPVAAIISIVSIVPYFFFLYFIRHKLKRIFNFRIEKSGI